MKRDKWPTEKELAESMAKAVEYLCTQTVPALNRFCLSLDEAARNLREFGKAYTAKEGESSPSTTSTRSAAES